MIEGQYTQSWGSFAPTGFEAAAIAQSVQAPDSLWGSLARRMVLTARKTPLDVERFGVKLRLYPSDNLCEKRALLTPERFDPAERHILLDRIHPEFRFVDIGANIGLYSLLVAAAAGPKGRVLAVEPQPVIKQRLRFNLLANKSLQIIHADCAVAAKKGVARMSLSRQNRGAAGFALRSGAKPDDEFMVQTRVLSELLHTHDMHGADALKMDIEGAEDQVLPGYFEDTPTEGLPKLLILERNPDWSVDCIELAQKCGYRLIEQAHMNVVLER
ncbi:MAG: hypothetical protein COA47_00285 [Robiginitomaculum sp.]|nr:MAG: hypothetical protein COA47_00285 [Robiginitomaculum sp.]